MPFDYGSKPPALPKPPQPPPLPQAPTINIYGQQPNAMDLQAAYQAFHPSVPAVQPALPSITPDETNYFDTAATRAKQQFGHAIAQDQYTQSTELQNHNLALQSLGKRYGEMRNRLPGSFVRRGVGQSGIAQAGYKDFNADRDQAYFAENLRHQRGIGQHKITQDQTAEVWDSTMKDLEKQRTARLNTIAALARQNG